MDNLVIINCDGLCEPNPGGVATYGWLAVSGATNNVLIEKSGLVTVGDGATNNLAEYRALLDALVWCERKAAFFLAYKKQVEIRTDSQLVVSQVNGLWKCNSDNLLPLLNMARGAIKRLDGQGVVINLKWVPREENEAADSLSGRAYTDHTGRAVPVRQKRPKTPGLSGTERYHPTIQKREKELRA
jgi:ribonuclease HI